MLLTGMSHAQGSGDQTNHKHKNDNDKEFFCNTNKTIVSYKENNIMICNGLICQFCYSGTSSKLFDLSQNCVLESRTGSAYSKSWSVRFALF